MRIVGVQRAGAVEVANLTGAGVTIIASLAEFWAGTQRLLAERLGTLRNTIVGSDRRHRGFAR